MDRIFRGFLWVVALCLLAALALATGYRFAGGLDTSCRQSISKCFAEAFENLRLRGKKWEDR